MSNLPTAPEQGPQQPDPSLIEWAPIEPEGQGPFGEAEQAYLGIIGDLSSRLEILEAENEQLRTKKTIEEVRAELLGEFPNKVFKFVVGYCVGVGVLLVANGFSWTGFSLPESIFGWLIGSSGLAVIGLIGTLIAGLFRR